MTTIKGAGKPGWRTIRFEVLEKIESLPSLNSVVNEFLGLARKEFFSAKDFENVLSKDQALVARLLKVANSGLYGPSRSISSIPEAVVLIGLEKLKRIVYAVSCEELTSHKMSNYNYHPQQGFWLHSLGVAQAAKVLAEASSICNLRGEEAFIAGLLHDVGKLVIDEFLSTESGAVVSCKDEITAVGINHAELSEYILKQWNLPESITSTILYHHAVNEGGEFKPGSAVLSLAQKICYTWGVGKKNPVDLSQEIPADNFEKDLSHLNILQEKWDQIIWDIRQHLVGFDDAFTSD